MAYERREFAGGAVATTLVADISSGATTFAIADTSGWPSGGTGKFLVVIGRNTATEEKLLVQSRSGATLTLASSGDRGADDTTATSHTAGAPVEHVAGAIDANEANYTTNQTVGKAVTKGDMLVATGTNVFARQGVGANNTVLVYDSAQTTGVKAASVDQNMIATTVAGNGLAGGGGSALSINVDNSTVEISADSVRVKDAGITPAKLAASAPRGYVTHAVVTAAQLGITTDVPLTGFTVTFTPASASRILKLSWQVPVQYGTGENALIAIHVNDGVTTKDSYAYQRIWATNERDTLTGFYLLQNAAVTSYTYSLTGSTNAANDFRVAASAFVHGYLLVEDIGGT